PRRYIRDQNNSEELSRKIEDFLRANESIIKATKILFDFRAGVAPFVIRACEMALQRSPYSGIIDEVVIINENF
ncbi:MAG: hypothetical protein Q8K34_21335, partial [Hydrogenophaga sp.]|nr:hypothetical protein [Hydrogenophaga sp.]